jgi:hypothetical protein
MGCIRTLENGIALMEEAREGYLDEMRAAVRRGDIFVAMGNEAMIGLTNFARGAELLAYGVLVCKPLNILLGAVCFAGASGITGIAPFGAGGLALVNRIQSGILD